MAHLCGCCSVNCSLVPLKIYFIFFTFSCHFHLIVTVKLFYLVATLLPLFYFCSHGFIFTVLFPLFCCFSVYFVCLFSYAVSVFHSHLWSVLIGCCFLFIISLSKDILRLNSNHWRLIMMFYFEMCTRKCFDASGQGRRWIGFRRGFVQMISVQFRPVLAPVFICSVIFCLSSWVQHYWGCSAKKTNSKVGTVTSQQYFIMYFSVLAPKHPVRN